nr:MAG TPA: hypothetical protein [Caudoviricetes sp.]
MPNIHHCSLESPEVCTKLSNALVHLSFLFC